MLHRQVKAFVDGGMASSDTAFIDAVSGIVNRGCPRLSCPAGGRGSPPHQLPHGAGRHAAGVMMPPKRIQSLQSWQLTSTICKSARCVWVTGSEGGHTGRPFTAVFSRCLQISTSRSAHELVPAVRTQRREQPPPGELSQQQVVVAGQTGVCHRACCAHRQAECHPWGRHNRGEGVRAGGRRDGAQRQYTRSAHVQPKASHARAWMRVVLLVLVAGMHHSPDRDERCERRALVRVERARLCVHVSIHQAPPALKR
jgi:hypothetical protein